MASTDRAPWYRWADLAADRPLGGLERRRVVGERVMLAQVRLEPGCVVPAHAHDNEQVCCVLSGRLRFGLGGEGGRPPRQVEVAAGEVLHLPSGVRHSAEALEPTLVIDVFSPPSEKTGIDRA
jgi:quercetin dioxygenase-like cupin family protein